MPGHRSPSRRDTNVIFEQLHDLLSPNHQRRKPQKTHHSPQAAPPEASPTTAPTMPHAQSPSSPGELSHTSRASTIFFSAVSRLRFTNAWSPRRRRSSSSSDNSVIARSMRGFRFPSVETKPHHRFIDQAHVLNDFPPVFIPNGGGLMAGFTYHSDTRSSIEKARSRKWAEWRCGIKRMPERVRRRMKSFGRKVRRNWKRGFWV